MDVARKNTPPAHKPWVSILRAMELLGLKTRYTLLGLVARGELEGKAEDNSGRLFISRASIDRYLEQQNAPSDDVRAVVGG